MKNDETNADRTRSENSLKERLRALIDEHFEEEEFNDSNLPNQSMPSYPEFMGIKDQSNNFDIPLQVFWDQLFLQYAGYLQWAGS